MTVRIGEAAEAPAFPQAARAALGDEQLRQQRQARDGCDAPQGGRVVAELGDWEALREQKLRS